MSSFVWLKMEDGRSQVQAELLYAQDIVDMYPYLPLLQCDWIALTLTNSYETQPLQKIKENTFLLLQKVIMHLDFI